MEKEDKLLHELIQENLEKSGPPMSFTSNVMSKIEAKQPLKNKPIIGKVGWLTLTTLFLGITISVFLMPELEPAPEFPDVGVRYLSQLFQHFNIPVFGIFIMVLFIIADEGWRRINKINSGY